MYVIRWSVILVLSSLALMWLSVVIGWYQPSSWQYSIRVLGGVYFFLAIAASGVITHQSYPKDWAFIFLSVTITLFGISLFFH
ncbi:hypothetical protein GCM10011571_08890 [Marinithermofilum abyssi]|uniref:Uncharacterized protein n=1 Tax=Marinithermofilum abyssi TaxID=1571185 RepID=A0A8J2VGK0_9BACL|nr:hypothetical protein [Marinithermofilum abyssi]GGE09794.1 hypothetical protein GCM10011571_08890 [Marinithermofilum abyssi]